MKRQYLSLVGTSKENRFPTVTETMLYSCCLNERQYCSRTTIKVTFRACINMKGGGFIIEKKVKKKINARAEIWHTYECVFKNGTNRVSGTYSSIIHFCTNHSYSLYPLPLSTCELECRRCHTSYAL